jgi:uncharacterized protein (TIGR00255 family)
MTDPAEAVPPPSALASMTGFARREGVAAGATWTWEARSVNGKALDIKCRLPMGFDRLEGVARAAVARRFRRGSISLGLTVARVDTALRMTINRPFLDNLIDLARSLEGQGLATARIDGLLAIRGVVEPAGDPAEGEDGAIEAAAEAALAPLLDDLAAARSAEGARLSAVLMGQIAAMARLAADAAATAAAQPDARRRRLEAQVAALLEAVPALPADRLAQEAALLAVRGDITEELDRLVAHVAQARDLLREGTGVGRRLDFLCQEFNREANTLCSKSTDIALTRIGLALKAAIEQLREQVQNIE